MVDPKCSLSRNVSVLFGIPAAHLWNFLFPAVIASGQERLGRLPGSCPLPLLGHVHFRLTLKTWKAQLQKEVGPLSKSVLFGLLCLNIIGGLGWWLGDLKPGFF